MAFTLLHTYIRNTVCWSRMIKDLVSHAKELGMDTVHITDHGAMFGVIDFIKNGKNRIKFHNRMRGSYCGQKDDR